MADVKEIIIDKFIGISNEERDLPNGYFRYLENLNIGDHIGNAIQTLTTTNTTSTRSLRAVINQSGTFWFLGDDGGRDVGIYKKVGAAFTGYQITANYTIASKYKPFFIIENGYAIFDNTDHIGIFKLDDQTNDGDFLTTGDGVPAGGLSGGVSVDKYIWGWNGQKLYRVWPGDYSSTQTIVEKISIPNDQTIRDILPYGNNLLAVICTSSTSDSLMYIYDGVSTTEFYDIVTIGAGDVAGGCFLDGIITVPIGNGRDFRIKQYDEISFKTVSYYQGATDNAGGTSVTLSGDGRVRSYKGYMYFSAVASRPNTATAQESPVIYRFGRKTLNDLPSLSVYKYFDFKPTVDGDIDFILYDNTSAMEARIFALIYDTSATTPHGYKEVQNTYLTARTVDLQEGIIETGIYTEDASIKKALKSVNIQLSALPAAGKVVVKYKADAETTWTTIATNAVDDTISHTSVNIESTGVNLPEFREIAFRIELSGGAEITQFKAKYEEKYGI